MILSTLYVTLAAVSVSASSLSAPAKVAALVQTLQSLPKCYLPCIDENAVSANTDTVASICGILLGPASDQTNLQNCVISNCPTDDLLSISAVLVTDTLPQTCSELDPSQQLLQILHSFPSCVPPCLNPDKSSTVDRDTVNSLCTMINNPNETPVTFLTCLYSSCNSTTIEDLQLYMADPEHSVQLNTECAYISLPQPPAAVQPPQNKTTPASYPPEPIDPSQQLLQILHSFPSCVPPCLNPDKSSTVDRDTVNSLCTMINNPNETPVTFLTCLYSSCNSTTIEDLQLYMADPEHSVQLNTGCASISLPQPPAAVQPPQNKTTPASYPPVNPIDEFMTGLASAPTCFLSCLNGNTTVSTTTVVAICRAFLGTQETQNKLMACASTSCSIVDVNLFFQQFSPYFAYLPQVCLAVDPLDTMTSMLTQSPECIRVGLNGGYGSDLIVSEKTIMGFCQFVRTPQWFEQYLQAACPDSEVVGAHQLTANKEIMGSLQSVCADMPAVNQTIILPPTFDREPTLLLNGTRRAVPNTGSNISPIATTSSTQPVQDTVATLMELPPCFVTCMGGGEEQISEKSIASFCLLLGQGPPDSGITRFQNCVVHQCENPRAINAAFAVFDTAMITFAQSCILLEPVSMVMSLVQSYPPCVAQCLNKGGRSSQVSVTTAQAMCVESAKNYTQLDACTKASCANNSNGFAQDWSISNEASTIMYISQSCALLSKSPTLTWTLPTVAPTLPPAPKALPEVVRVLQKAPSCMLECLGSPNGKTFTPAMLAFVCNRFIYTTHYFQNVDPFYSCLLTSCDMNDSPTRVEEMSQILGIVYPQLPMACLQLDPSLMISTVLSQQPVCLSNCLAQAEHGVSVLDAFCRRVDGLDSLSTCLKTDCDEMDMQVLDQYPNNPVFMDMVTRGCAMLAQWAVDDKSVNATKPSVTRIPGIASLSRR
ncbi:hypothetical protein BJ741DRAFT_709433 [Chytriomyces cf. hyalinus JEL632]|nr:hypothetical protein BJ741DRAFT_709433 [Chytriomyces cf. hyalinus JEL632]